MSAGGILCNLLLHQSQQSHTGLHANKPSPAHHFQFLCLNANLFYGAISVVRLYCRGLPRHTTDAGSVNDVVHYGYPHRLVPATARGSARPARPGRALGNITDSTQNHQTFEHYSIDSVLQPQAAGRHAITHNELRPTTH